MLVGVTGRALSALRATCFGDTRVRVVSPLLFVALLSMAPGGEGTAFAQPYTIETFTGGILPPDGTLASLTPVGNPTGGSVDGQGNLYVAVPILNIVVRVDGKTQKVLRIAGSGGSGYNGDNLLATNAELNYPSSVAVDSAGNVYIADSGNSRIRMVSGGVITTVAGGAQDAASENIPATSAGLNFPEGIAFDTGGNLYIVDTFSNRVRVVSGGMIHTVAGALGNGGYSGDNGPATQAAMFDPTAVALDSAGNLYIADSDNNLIRKVSNGTITTVAGLVGGHGQGGLLGYNGDNMPATSAELNEPIGVAVDSSGTLYIADTFNHRVRKVVNGIITTLTGTGTAGYNGDNIPAATAEVYRPSSLWLDSLGNLFIADAGNCRVRKVSLSSSLIATVAGNGNAGDVTNGIPASSAEILSPLGTVVGAGGEVYSADPINNLVRVISNGVMTTVAGTGTPGFNGDNQAATAAQLSYPRQLALDASGNLYIADQGNNRIRKVSGGMITTVAGNGKPGYSGDSGLATLATLSAPSGVALDAAGNIYIADVGNNVVREVSALTGVITTVVGGGPYEPSNTSPTSTQLAGPNSVAVDSAGSLYVADYLRIWKVSSGTVSTAAGAGGTSYWSGDIPATSAGLNPMGVAVDSAGNLFIADGPNRVETVIAATGMIRVIAGVEGGVGGYNGDGIPGPAAQLSHPGAVALDAEGNIYIADAGNNRVRVLVPPGCVTSLSAGGLSFATSGGTGTITITAPSGCNWNIIGAPSWVTFTSPASGTGSGTVTFTVNANSGSSLSGGFALGGIPFRLQQASATSASFNLIGSMAQIASGGGWETTLNLVNTSGTQGEALVNVWGDPEGALPMPFTFPQSATAPSPLVGATLDQTIGPNALLILDSQQPNNLTPQVGSAQLLAAGSMDGFAIFRYQPSGQEAVVPLEKRNAASYVLPFDNTGGLSTGVALAGISGSPQSVPVTIRDDTGKSLGTDTVALDAQGHTYFLLPQKYAATAGIRGTVEFDAPSGLYGTAGAISVLGLRSAPIGTAQTDFAVTTLPVLANVSAGSGLMAHVAAGFGWQTTFTLVNVGNASASVHLAFADGNGVALPLPLTFPQTGQSVTEASVDAEIAAGATLIVVANDTNLSLVGSAQLSTTGSVGGFAIFRYNSTGQEAVVPLETGNAPGYLLTYDNTNGLVTGVAIAAVAGQAVNVPVTIRDDTGATLGTSTVSLTANGHTMFLLTDSTSGFPVTAGTRGTVEFDTPAGAQIGIVGLRSSPITGGFAVTTVPPLAKQ